MVSKRDSKTYAFFTAFLSIIGFIIAILVWRRNKYVMFYAKQSLIVFIVAIAAGIVVIIISWIPIIGWLIALVLRIGVFAAWILSWIYATSGRKKEVPVIGSWARKIDL